MRVSAVNGFGGIDQRAAFSSSPSVASSMMNFRVTDSGSLIKRNGIERLWKSSAEIEYIWSGSLKNDEMVIIASGGRLFRMEAGMTPAIVTHIGEIGTGKCFIFEFNGLLYIKTADSYHKYDGATLTEVEGYIPLVAISCAPDGSGEAFEQINLISEKRRQSFSATGKTFLYQLAERDIDSVISVKIDGVESDLEYQLDKAKGSLTFTAMLPEGTNNVEITYAKSNDSDFKSRIFGCTRMMVFGGNSDGRIFLWGNEDYPNYRFNSDLADGVPSAEYFPVNGFTIIGNSRINCIVQQYDKQLIFTENQAFYSYCELRTDSLGNVYSSFPVFNLNNGKGCIFETDGCIIDNRPITLCADGLNMWESTSVVNEKNALCFSSPIQAAIREIICGDLSSIRMFDFQANRELFFVYEDRAYIYNYGNQCWYCYDDFVLNRHSVYGRLLYFSRGNSLYLYGNDHEVEMNRDAYWESAFIDGGNEGGRCDLLRLEADVHIYGRDRIRFDFIDGGSTQACYRELHFPELSDKYARLYLRPALRRAMPFKIIFTDHGPGRCVLHGFSFKTKNKERSYRHGIR